VIREPSHGTSVAGGGWHRPCVGPAHIRRVEIAFWILGAFGLWLILAGGPLLLPVLSVILLGLIGTILLGID
jgi:hypothetical protein